MNQFRTKPETTYLLNKSIGESKNCRLQIVWSFLPGSLLIDGLFLRWKGFGGNTAKFLPLREAKFPPFSSQERRLQNEPYKTELIYQQS
jgi:hypothetical protein